MAVLADVRGGVISERRARDAYGVAVHRPDGPGTRAELDAEATALLRSRLAEAGA